MIIVWATLIIIAGVDRLVMLLPPEVHIYFIKLLVVLHSQFHGIMIRLVVHNSMNSLVLRHINKDFNYQICPCDDPHHFMEFQ